MAFFVSDLNEFKPPAEIRFKNLELSSTSTLHWNDLIHAYCDIQGADTVIYERLSRAGRTFADSTLAHLEEFGNQGLRTLCLAYRCGRTAQWPHRVSMISGHLEWLITMQIDTYQDAAADES